MIVIIYIIFYMIDRVSLNFASLAFTNVTLLLRLQGSLE